MNNRLIFTTALLLGLTMIIFAHAPEYKWGLAIQRGSGEHLDINDVYFKKNKGYSGVKKGEKKILEKALYVINFKSGRATINKSSYGILDKVVSIMKDNSKYNLRIEGHTDSQGDETFNLKLSKNRALAVKNYLMRKGIGADRLSIEGFGAAVPIADNKTAKGRAENRRVELTVLKRH